MAEQIPYAAGVERTLRGNCVAPFFGEMHLDHAAVASRFLSLEVAVPLEIVERGRQRRRLHAEMARQTAGRGRFRGIEGGEQRDVACARGVAVGGAFWM